jgi:serine/threonine protein kinase
MITRSEPCNDENLAVLLDGDDNSQLFRQAASHVDSCAKCQRRLTELSADANYWIAQREMLRPLDGDLSDSGTLRRYRSADSTPWRRSVVDESTVKELLSAPSHPEMLGRLGRYEIERIIGNGGMGIVLKAFDSELNRPVAIKMLAPHLARVGAARQRFAREARAAAAVVHEHVVPIHNVESEHANPFLVMQYIPGESLQARVERAGPLSVPEMLRIGLQAASGLAAAHAQGLVHRDVKPANILLENGVERAYLTDFGLARASDDASLTHTGVLAGTPNYMSPEQADGQPLDHRSDLFSLGSVLYFMATGHPPFRADRPMAVLKRTCHDPHRPAWECNAEIPDSLSAIVDRLLEKTPARRFATAAELHHALAKVLANVQQGKLGRRQRKSRTRSAIWLRTVGVLAVFTVGGISTAWLVNQRPNGKSGEGTQRATHDGFDLPRSPLINLQLNDLESEAAWLKNAEVQLEGNVGDANRKLLDTAVFIDFEMLGPTMARLQELKSDDEFVRQAFTELLCRDATTIDVEAFLKESKKRGSLMLRLAAESNRFWLSPEKILARLNGRDWDIRQIYSPLVVARFTKQAQGGTGGAVIPDLLIYENGTVVIPARKGRPGLSGQLSTAELLELRQNITDKQQFFAINPFRLNEDGRVLNEGKAEGSYKVTPWNTDSIEIWVRSGVERWHAVHFFSLSWPQSPERNTWPDEMKRLHTIDAQLLQVRERAKGSGEKELPIAAHSDTTPAFQRYSDFSPTLLD